MPDLSSGSVFAGHRIDGIAGRGGMGVVYRATHLALDHAVALKVISPNLAGDPRFRRRFADESRIAVSLRHPNVVQIHHAGEEDGLLFVTMDLIEGTDLRGLLHREQRLDPAHAVAIIAQVAAALDVAHAKGLVHRDIKPGNVLIETRPEGEHVYLTDFGLARQIEASTGVTATGAFVGTLDYVAPEQIKGERVDARSDVYALGCVLFELLTGNAPFAAREDKVAKMYAHLQEEPPRLRVLMPELPGELDLVLARALAKDPADRFPSAGDLARAAEAAIAGEPTVETERSVATGAAAPGPPEATTTAERGGPSAAPTEARRAAESATTRAELRAANAPPAEAITIDRPPGSGDEPPAGPPARPGGSRRRTGPLLALIGVLAAAVIAGVLLVGGGEEKAGDGAEQTTTNGGDGGGGQGDGGEGPAKGVVEGEQIAVGELPVGIAHGDGVWTANRGGNSISQVDTAEFSSGKPIAVGFPAEGIAVDAKRNEVWVSDFRGNTVTRFDTENPGESTEFTVGPQPGEIALGKGAAWVANSGDGTVSRISLRNGEVETIPTGQQGTYGIAFGAGDVWVTNRISGTVTRIDADDRAVVDEDLPAGANPKGIAVSNNTVWVASTDDDEVTWIDVVTLEEKSVGVGESPRDVVSAFGSIWVTNGESNSVTQLSPEGKEIAEIDVGAGPEGITFGPNFLWVANGEDNSVTAIDPGTNAAP